MLSAALMLDFLGENAAAERVRSACEPAVTGTTVEIGNAIAARLASK
jgi:isocitrate/isopropylmalate dehydrogenase